MASIVEFLPGTNIRVQRASQLVQDYLTTGSKTLDTFLYGGVPTFGVTEIVGEAGTGKTQFCLQLALNAQLPLTEKGLASECIYISTEQRFPAKRLTELSEHFYAKYRTHLRTQRMLPSSKPMDAVRIEHISDADSLINCLETRIPQLLQEDRMKPRLIIVDSVAVLFRNADVMEDVKKRTKDLRHVGTILHKLGRQLRAAIVVVNQVSGQLGDDDDTDQGNVPALGMAWKNCVTTRILLSREVDSSATGAGATTAFNDEELDFEAESQTKRSLSIKFAPHVPNRTIPIVLDQEGIKAGPNVPEYLLYQPSDSDDE